MIMTSNEWKLNTVQFCQTVNSFDTRTVVNDFKMCSSANWEGYIVNFLPNLLCECLNLVAFFPMVDKQLILEYYSSFINL